MPAPPEIDQASARALTEAGYMPLAEYLWLCEQNGWKPDPRLDATPPEQPREK